MATLQSMMSKSRTPPKGWGRFLDCAYRASSKHSSDSVRKDAHKALVEMGSEPIQKASVQVESNPIYGGYAVPPDFNLAIATSYEEECFLYPRATVVPMRSRTTQLPRVNAETAQSAGTPPWWGGFNLTWGMTPTSGNEETGTIAQTNLTLVQNELTARSLIGTMYASQDLHQDIQNGGEAFFFNMFARAAAYAEEYAFFNGKGGVLDQPQGIITSDSFKTTARAGSGHLAVADAKAMAAGMTPRGWMHAIWACSPSCIPDVTGMTGFIPNQAGFETYGMSCLGSIDGRPLFVTDKLPILGTIGDFVFIDPTQYIIGDRAELIVQISDEFLFNTNQIVYRVWRRVDGQPLFSRVITETSGTTTVSPFNGIAT